MARPAHLRLALAFAVAAASAGGLLGASACGKDYAAAEPSPLADGEADVSSVDAGVDAAVDAPTCDPGKVASKTNHCGRCGHTCFGGSCIGGRCQPVELGRTQSGAVIDVAVDAANVYWLTSTAIWSGLGGLYACPRAGCGGSPKSLTGSEQTGSLGSDGIDTFASFVYATRKIGRVSANGFAAIQGLAHQTAVRLQVVDKKLYYLALGETTGTDAGSYSGTVFRWDGVKEEELATFVGGENLFDLVVTGTHLFLSDYSEILTCELGDCLTRKPFFSDSGFGSLNLATDGKQLFWRNTRSEVLSCDVAGPCTAPRTVLGPAQLGAARVRGVSFAREKLYISTSNNDIFECPPSGCPADVKPRIHGGPLFVLNEDSYGHGVTADDEAIYWTEVVPGPSGDAAESSTAAHRLLKLAK